MLIGKALQNILSAKYKLQDSGYVVRPSHTHKPFLKCYTGIGSNVHTNNLSRRTKKPKTAVTFEETFRFRTFLYCLILFIKCMYYF